MKNLLLRITGLIVLLFVSGAVNSELMALQKSSRAILVSNKLAADEHGETMVSLADLLTMLEQNFEATFLFKDEVVQQKRVNTDKIQLGEHTGQQLAEILDQLGLTYSQVDKQTYVLLPKKNLLAKGIAQEQISGTVTDTQSGETLPGVNILVKGTSTGTSTNAEGQYELTVESLQDTLVASYIGFQTQDVPIKGRAEINIEMQSQAISGEEMVVTAIGIKRQRESVGYSVSQVKTEDIVQGSEPSIANLLEGKVSGMTVSPTGGGPASSTRVTIRGASSLSGNNQPLYVVDGVPIDNSNIGSAGQWGGTDGGDGIQSLNAEDIENISVLKGASASALYGERARDGVILITTKSGQQTDGININFSSNITYEQPRVKMDEIQTTYGQGTAGRRPQSQTEAQNTNIASWGEPFDGQPSIQWDGVTRPYEDIGSKMGFYKNKFSSNNNISVSGGSETSTYYFSASRLDNKGLVPTSSHDRTSLTLRSTTQIEELISVDVKANYIKENTSRATGVSDAPGNVNTLVNRLPRNVPFSSFKNNYITDDHTEISPYPPYVFINNPYWTLNESAHDSERDRFIGHVKLDLDLTDWLVMTARTGMDWYTLRRFTFQGPGTAYNLPGSLSEIEYRVRELNSKLLLNANYNITESISIDGIMGASNRHPTNEAVGANGSGYINPNLKTLSNMQNQAASYDFSEKKVRSFFGSANIGYNDYLFLTLTGRNDWSSTLPEDSNSFFYPSVSSSFVFSKVFDVPQWMSYGQLRASWAKVGSDTDPYQLNITYGYLAGGHRGQPLGTIAQNSIPLQNLKPTITKEVELGFDIRFLEDRLNFDFTWYDRSTINQILATNVSQTTGYGSRIINAGQLDNTGIEMQFSTTPVAKHDYLWESTINFSRNKSMVVELTDQQDILTLAESRTRLAWITAQEGKEYGTIRGYAYRRDNNGNIVHQNGLPIQGDLKILGRGTPDWAASWSNNVSYKNLSLNVLVGIEWGGQLYSGSNAYLYGTGLHEETLVGRAACDANRMPNSQWAPNCFVAEGVDIDGGPNQTGVRPNVYYQRIASLERDQTGRIAEEFVYDKNLIQLRQLRLSYQLPTKNWFGGIGIRSASVSLIGRNLFFIYNPIPNVDPASGINRGNAQGLELEGVPQTRSFGLSVDLQF